ncbi:MAG: family peptidase [Hyphomicrobiales bacterium]|nr:family peptidase [Hyphomicrobiales bacterium]
MKKPAPLSAPAGEPAEARGATGASRAKAKSPAVSKPMAQKSKPAKSGAPDSSRKKKSGARSAKRAEPKKRTDKAALAALAAGLPPPPLPVRKRPVSRTFHGETIVDEYGWLRAPNWQKVLRNPAALPKDIRAVLTAENAYADAVLKPQRELRKTLVKEMRGRIKEDDSDPPSADGPWQYYNRYRKGAQHPLVCRRPRKGGREHILLDCAKMAEGKAFFDLAAATHSPNHAMVAWSVDVKGSEYFTLRIRDVKSGKDLRDKIPDTDGSVVWFSDASGFYYIRMDENHRPCRVYRHRLGEAPDHDELVFEEFDPRWFVRIGETQSGAYATIEVEDHEAAETYLLDLSDPHAQPVLVEPKQPKLRYDVDHHGDHLFILTNAHGCEDFKIMQAPLANPRLEHWTELVPHKPGRMITGCVAYARHLVRTELEDGLPRIVIRDIASGEEHVIEHEGDVYDLDLDEVLEFDTNVMRFGYSSLKEPSEIWSYDMTTRARTLLKRQIIPSGHNPDDYVTRRIMALSHDGASVPISLLHARSTPIDGTAPLLLEGYGSYGDVFEAHFSTTRLSLVDRGFVYAIAHIRGGTDKGWNWYLDGKLEKKPNTFHDFIACGRRLAQEKYTSEGRIVALGGSAGGMLMGAVANMAPELFAGVIADVPFVDVLNTMLDDTLPLTPPEWLEWGNPISDPKAFDAIRAYSPYDNVKPQHYPPILAEAGLTDPRVTYWEPAKWVARLRAKMTGGGPILLRTNMDAGHGGASGRFDRLNEIALEFAFAIWAAQRRAPA